MDNSAHYEDIEYISQFIKYADDEHIGKLISKIYDKEIFYNPYDTNLELFLNMLMFDDFSLDYGNITLEDIRNDKIIFFESLFKYRDSSTLYNLNPKLFFEKLLNDIEQSPYKNNIYVNFIFTIINKYENIVFCNGKKYNHNYGNEIIFTDNFDGIENFEKLLVVYNSIFLPLDKSRRELFIKLIIDIVKSINSFKVTVKDYKLFFNKAIDKIIKNNHFYIIENNVIYCRRIDSIANKSLYDKRYAKLKLIESENKLYILEENKNKTQEIKHKTSICNKDGHSLINIKSYDSYKQSFQSLEMAVCALQKKEIDLIKQKNLKKKEHCHICNPYADKKKRNTKENKNNNHKCDICKQIYEEIQAIDPEYTTEKISMAIKLKSKIEREESAKFLRNQHYERLNKLLRKLNKKCNEERMEKIKSLVDKAFRVRR